MYLRKENFLRAELLFVNVERCVDIVSKRYIFLRAIKVSIYT
jgi:hypothetical protein